MDELTGKVAVITGGASGIGLAMANEFGAQGMRLVLADIETTALDAATKALGDKGFEVLGVPTDVTDFASVQALAARAVERFGAVHVIVNNAGVSITGPTWELSLDDWRWVHAVNVWGVIHGVKAFVPLMLEQGAPAHVINTASLAAFNAAGEHAPYSSSKAAVVSISQALYSELAALNTQVGVSVVCPGMVDTRIHQSWRVRPADDKPWSDREWNDDRHRAGSEAFQGAGVPPEDIARLTLEALRENRFFVFNGERWDTYVRVLYDAALNGTNPPVLTWGPDLRPTAGSGGAHS